MIVNEMVSLQTPASILGKHQSGRQPGCINLTQYADTKYPPNAVTVL